MNLQALVDGMSAQWQRERAESQLTLGSLIAALEALSPDALIQGIQCPRSYRGYYSDLAFEPAKDKTPVNEALSMCRSAMGRVFKGYKGGDYVMGEHTPVWLADYGCCGLKLMALNADGSFETAEDEI